MSPRRGDVGRVSLRELVGRLLAWRHRDELDRDLSSDIEAHIELLARDLEHDGMSRPDALAAARRQVGNVTGLRERSRDAWGFPAVEAAAQDVRYALRGLRRSPGFTATVIVTLALGIGANAAIFGVIDRVMFRPYPYLRDPGAVNRVYTETTYRGRVGANTVFPWLRYNDIKDVARIGTFGAETEWRFAVGTGADSRVKKVAGLSASLVSFFDATPVQGRWFQPAEDVPPSGAPVAVVSYGMWQSDFGGADVVGKPLKVGIIDYTIVGVAPPGFVAAAAGGAPDVFVPITTIPGNLGSWSVESYTRDYNWDWVQVFMRRNTGVTEADATAALTDAYKRSRAIARIQNPRVLPDSIAYPRGVAGPVKQAAGPGAGRESRVLLWVTGVALIVLIIACANVANLMFARVIRRRREVSVRLALGVRRGRLVMQFLVEGLVLALIGTVVGLGVAQWGGVAIRSLLLPDGTPFNLADDWRTLGVAAACATAAALLTTIGPALMATRGDVAASLKAGAREGTYHRSTTRAALLVLQGALSVLLLVGAGLFVRSFSNARAVPLGYDARPVLEAVLDYRGFVMDSAAAMAEYERMRAAALAIPGVVDAARVNNRLFSTGTSDLYVDGIDSVAALGRFNQQVASPSYFNVMQIRILRGRAFSDQDRDGAALVIVVSQSMAQVLWPGQDPLGKCIHVGRGGLPAGVHGPCRTVIGVAENNAQQNITDDPRFMYYMPVAQRWPNSVSTLYLRVAAPDARGEMERVRRELTRAMPGDGFAFVRPLQEVVDDQSRSWRLGASLFVAFGALALVVALVGLYGVISYNVAQRTHELGVRVALGARAADVVRLVLGQGMRLAALGVAIGLAIALGAARWVQPMLFGLSAKDPATYAVVAAAMMVAALAACFIPAMRAARADPNTALRAD